MKKLSVMWSWKWVVLWSLWAARVVRQPTAAVRVRGGWLRGTIAPAGTHKQYLGVPYATVTHRFQAPGPEPTWDGIFDAIEENIICEQAISLGSKYTQGRRDCLILNVYTPLNVPQDKLLPVMVFIHGGGFFQRSSSPGIYGPEYLVSKGIILVTLNYRLNIQGFLCLGIKEAPGNAGMKDQVAVLKWIQRNIRAFGGNPNSVTLFGESAGAASVSYHVLSPMSKGLFHKAIIQSGSSLGSWSHQYKPVYIASLLAKVMGFHSQDPRELYNFFMDKSDTELIITRVPRKEGNVIFSEVLYVPCVEERIEGEEPFLPELPYDILKKGTFNKVPIIIGVNTEEGLLFVEMETESQLKNLTFEKSLPKDLVFPSDVERQRIGDELKNLYMGDDKIPENLLKLSKFYGEPFTIYPSLEETDLIAKSSDKPIYMYLFGYDGWRNMLKLMLPNELKNVTGATHADELFYLFCSKFIPSFFEDKMINIMSSMWTNFAKLGDPTPAPDEQFPIKWPAVTKDDQRALLIDQKPSTVPLWHSPSLLFWKDVYSKYRRKLAPGPEPTWTGTYEAVEENVRCIQAMSDDSDTILGRPDCLHLNVYTPLNTSPEDSLPVMVFFHGGGFFMGSSSPALYGPNYLINKGVILVTANYRLSVQGFLCLGIKEAPGNAGLKDQVAALKWVQRNIKAFGGDPENVTIFGESAGSASVSYHIVSPMSKGLFHKAILQSGSSLTSWAMQYDPVHIASQKAKLLGFQSSDPLELYKFLYSQTDEDLITKRVPREDGNTIVSQLIFVPCVEKQFDNEEPFLTEAPYEIYSKGNFNKVPMIIGLNTEEGLFFVSLEKDHFIPKIKFETSMPKNLAFPSNKDQSEVAREVQRMYMGDEEISFQNLYNLSQFYGDAYIEYPALEETNIITLHSDKPVYNYLLHYDGRRNLVKFLHQKKEFQNITGATHADDLLYIFSQQIVPSLFENDIIDKITTMWTNFAKYGDPTPSTSELVPVRWPTAAKQEENRHVLLIDKELSVIPQPKKPSLALWKDVYRKYRRKQTSYSVS